MTEELHRLQTQALPDIEQVRNTAREAFERENRILKESQENAVAEVGKLRLLR
eukprot:EC788589.1.p3 GENE.EC788589.1~~EC788589.1.p3  ORF type:complete len:53 (-),score=19.28 EC788589.1:225-383(-)